MLAKGWEVHAVQADVGNLEGCQHIIAETIRHFGRIDLLINNAGVNQRGRLEDTRPEALRLVMDINYLGSLYMTRLALPQLKANQGGVLFISSVAGIHGLPLHGVYSASKMALTALAESLRMELAKMGVYVGIAYVGLTENETGKTIYNGAGEKVPKEDVDIMGLMPIEKVADGIIKMITQQKFKRVFSFLGKLNAILNRISPELVQFILTKAYLKRGW